MTKKGKLSNMEKYVVKGMLGDNKTVDEIAVELDRTSASIQKYVDGELDKVCSTVAHVQEESTRQVASPEHIGATKKKLKDAGVTDLDIDKLLDKSFKTLRSKNMFDVSSDMLYVECITNMRAGNFMIKKTAGQKQSGVAIMTQAASTRMDEARKSHKITSRSVRGNIFNPSTGEIE